MKHILFISMLLIDSIYTSAQPVAGKVFVGGSLGFWASASKSKTGGTTSTNYKQSEIGFYPQAGYFLNDRIAVGIGLGLNTLVYKNPDGTLEKRTSTGFSFEPFGRYYLISGKAGVFAEAFVRTRIGKDKSYYETVTVESNSLEFAAGVTPGIYYYITEKLALEAQIGWIGFESQVDKYSDDSKDIYNTFELNLHPSYFTFGMTFLL